MTVFNDLIFGDIKFELGMLHSVTSLKSLSKEIEKNYGAFAEIREACKEIEKKYVVSTGILEAGILIYKLENPAPYNHFLYYCACDHCRKEYKWDLDYYCFTKINNYLIRGKSGFDLSISLHHYLKTLKN
jgi:hypothetical protein